MFESSAIVFGLIVVGCCLLWFSHSPVGETSTEMAIVRAARMICGVVLISAASVIVGVFLAVDPIVVILSRFAR